MLALHRTGEGQDALAKARNYLTDLITNDKSPSSLSPIVLGALLYTWNESPLPNRLHFQARGTLDTLNGSADEGISFFDYLSSSGADQDRRIARDYICYPNLLPQSLLLDGLARQNKRLGSLKFKRQRFVLLEQIHSCLRHKDYFKHSGALYASSVDQALLAWSFDILNETPTRVGAFLYFLYRCYDNIYVKFVATILIPLVLIVAASIAIVDVSMLATIFGGEQEGSLGAWLIGNEELARVGGGVIIWATAPVPAAVVKWIRNRVAI